MPGVNPEADKNQQAGKSKCFLIAALMGSIAALSGAFAFCVYDAHYRLHQDWFGCAKYGAMVAAAFSHVIVIIGALAGVAVFALAYMAWFICRCCRHHFKREIKSNAQ